MSSPTPQANPTLSGPDKVHGLVSEFLDERKREHDAEASAKRRKRASPWMLAVFVAVAAGAWLIPFPPPSEARQIPERVTLAGARMEVYIAAQRVRQYRAEHGQLPSPLSEAGVRAPWITLQPLDSAGFELTASTDGLKVHYRSDMSDAAFFRETRAMLDGSSH